jgi:putative pre-16S rRNA nuclease
MTPAEPTAPHGTTTEDADDFAERLPATGRLIGLDLGTKTIGLALSDVTRMIASPLETIARKKFARDVEALNTHIVAHDVCGLVLGLPRNLDGSEGPRAQSSRAFARNLNRLVALPLLLWDERLTTAAAERLLIEADSSRRRRAQVIDKMAANLILQGALDRMRSDPP